jgi:hypothetical protein
MDLQTAWCDGLLCNGRQDMSHPQLRELFSDGSFDEQENKKNALKNPY